MMGAMRALVILVMLTGVAAAQPAPEDKAHADAAYAEGSSAYSASEFARAALKFEEAYALVPDPAYLFNIGQAYRQAKECAKAQAAFTKLLELVAEPEVVANVKTLLDEVKACTRPAPVVVPAPAPKQITITTPGSHRLAYIVGASGLALWAGTAVVGFVAKDRYDDAATFEDQQKWKDVVRYGGTSMFVVGTAALATSIILYLGGPRGEATVIAPAVGANQIGVAWSGGF
jgi:tetratricopeptide (TPR) repeat protein